MMIKMFSPQVPIASFSGVILVNPHRGAFPRSTLRVLGAPMLKEIP